MKWKVIKAYPKYIVSDSGLVKRIGGKVLNPGTDLQGYRVVTLYNGSRSSKKNFKVDRLVLMTFVSNQPKGTESCHNNGDPSDNRLINLRWDTHSNNVLDAIKHNTHVSTQGSNNGRSKLMVEDALEIWSLRGSGWSFKELGIRYGLHPEYVRLIDKKVYWSHAFELVI